MSLDAAVVLCRLHVPYTKPWILSASIFLLVDHAIRALKTRFRRATLSAMPGGFTKVEIPDLAGWRPGQHVRLRLLRGFSSWESESCVPTCYANIQDLWLRSRESTGHPFTIARSSDDGATKRYAAARQCNRFRSSSNSRPRLHSQSHLLRPSHWGCWQLDTVLERAR